MSPLFPPSRRRAVAWYLTSRDGRVARSALGITLGLAGFVFAGFIRWPLLLAGAALLVMVMMNVCPLGGWLHDSRTTPSPPRLRVIVDGRDLPEEPRRTA